MVEASDIQAHIKTIPDAFRLFPLPDVDVPQPEQWADFLMEHPGYVDNGHFHIAALQLADHREILEGMSEDYQKLGGNLIRILLSDDVLLRLHEGRYWTSEATICDSGE